MLKVFLVEDETVIREGLRDRIPWEQYGYRFVGEAADGEVALPLIRKTRPDVLITDIKMPFMDGLSLSRIVREEFPKTKILIISGYDDFEYAREAEKAANSSAKLFYNDFVGLASPGQMKAVVKYLADAKDAGNIDGLGMQAHQTNLGVADGDNIKNALKLFQQNGYEGEIKSSSGS